MKVRAMRVGAIVLLLVITSTGGLGCKNNKKEQQQAQQSQAGQRDAHKPDAFDTPGDPPFNAQTRFAAGQLAESQGKIALALEQYTAALAVDPNHRPSLFHLGKVYVEQKRFDEAIATWQRYVKATGESPAAFNNLALAYEQAGNVADAEKAYLAGISRDANDQACRVNYGLMLARQDRLDESLAQLSRALKPAEVHYNLGSVFEQRGRRQEAIAYYEKALELDPRLTDAKTRLAALR